MSIRTSATSSKREKSTSAQDITLYHKVLFIFSLAQLAATLLLVGLTSMAPATLLVLAVYGAGLAAFSYGGWKARPARVCGRVLQLLPTVGILLALAVVAYLSASEVSTSGVDAVQAWWGNYLAKGIMIWQVVSLFAVPSLALASRHGLGVDVNLLRVMAVLQLIAGGVLVFLPSLRQWLTTGVDSLYYDIFCVACLAVTAVAAFLIPPTLLKDKKSALPAKGDKDGE